MSLSIGIVGLPNAGKSTLFNALLGRQQALVAERPFTTIEPNTGIVDVPDERLEKLVELIKPEKSTPTTIKFIDIAGLVKGAHQGEGLGNKFLSHIRACDAILHLVRAFSNPAVTRAEGSVDPASDVSIVNLEMVLSDFEIIAKKLEEVAKKVKDDPSLKKFLGTLTKLKKVLGEGKFAIEADLGQEEKKLVDDFNLLTAKPMVYVLNTDEKGPVGGKGLPASFAPLQICALLEAELIGLGGPEREEFLVAMGIKEPGLAKLIKKTHCLLSLVTFYTIKGGKEVRAWSIKKGSLAIEAAGRVHTDMARGFVKAEVIQAKALFTLGSWSKARESGKLKLQGKKYQVADGDVIEFKFSI